MQQLFTSQTKAVYPFNRLCIPFYLSVLFLFFFITSVHGQPFEMKTISSFLDGAAKIKVADMDGDGDKDVIVGAYRANKIVWFEAPEWNEHTIVQNWEWAGYFDVADMDNDNNMDVVASAGTDDILAWFENPDWTQHTIDDNLNGACGVAAVDINGDDTLDVVCAGFYSNEIKWYEAPDWEEHLIDSEVTSGSATEGPEYIYVLDIDGDQDLDVICTSVDENDYSKGNIILYNGPEWAKQVIDNTASWTNAMVFADMDQDGDLDALATGMRADKIFMYELPDWTRTTIDNNLESAIGVDVGDLNMDGTLDVVGAGQVNANPLRWYTGSNWEQNTLYTAPDNMNTVCITDLNDDGDLDIVVTISELNKVVWFANQIIPDGIEQLPDGIPNRYSLSQNHPNPFNPSTTISFSIPRTEFVSLKVYNILGQEVATLVSDRLMAGSYQYTWDAGTLSSGVYYYKLQAGAYTETKKLILLR